MKKKKIKDIEQLKKNGWDIEQGDIDSVLKRKNEIDFNKNIEGLAEFVKLAAKMQGNFAIKIERVLAANTKVVAQGLNDLKDILDKPKNWEFEVRRNNGGFISKIFAKQI